MFIGDRMPSLITSNGNKNDHIVDWKIVIRHRVVDKG